MRTFKIIVILSVLVIMSSCIKPDGSSGSPDNLETTTIEPTGHTDGRFEVSYLCIDGQLYQAAPHHYSFESRSEAEKYLDEKGYEVIGEIAKCDPYSLPMTDYAATYLGVGTVLYSSDKEGDIAAINEEQQKIEFYTQTQ